MNPGMSADAQKKMAELQQQLGGKELTQENMAQVEQQKRQAMEMKEEMMAQLCTPEAIQRLKNIKLVKPQIYEQVENQVLNMARSGRMQGKIGEETMKQLLEKTGDAARVTKVKFERRRDPFDDDSDDNDDDLM